MARIRTIKPEFWQDERLAGIPRDYRLLYIGLWNIADDHGRLRGHPAFIKGQVFPYDPDVDVARGLDELAAARCIIRYTSDGQQFLFIRKFSDHQKMDKRTDSKLPQPTAEELAEPARKLAEPAQEKALEWKGKEGKGKEQGSGSAAEAAPLPAEAAGPEGGATDLPVLLGRAEALQELWNFKAHPDLPRWKGMSKQRRAAADARIKENPAFSHWSEVLDRMNRSRGLRGENDRGWKASPDWFLQPDSASRILEGKYDRWADQSNGRASEADKDWSGYAIAPDSEEVFEEAAP